MERFGNVYLVFNKKVYYYLYECACIQPLNRYIYKFCKLFKLPILKMLLDKRISNGDVENVIISNSTFSPQLYDCLNKIYSSSRLYLYYGDTITDTNVSYINYFDKGHVYTFDKKDAEKYGINYKHFAYSTKMVSLIDNNNSEVKYDTFFVGLAKKSRANDVERIYDFYVSSGINSKFCVFGDVKNEMKLSKWMSYKDYLNLLNESKTITEIIKQSQFGGSLRPMESLFLHKKLITNNVNIVDDEFYDSDNTYILNDINEQDVDKLKQFINSPYVYTTDEKIIEKLSTIAFDNWIQSFG